MTLIGMTSRVPEVTIEIGAGSGGAEAEFTDLVKAHHSDLVRLACAIVGDAHLANDVVQGAWVAAWKHRRDVRHPDRIRGWLIAITINEARRALRWRRLRQWARIGAEREPQVTHADTEGALDLLAVLQTLSVRDRQMLAMRYALRETSAEIGRAVGLSESGVRVRLARLLIKLREELDGD